MTGEELQDAVRTILVEQFNVDASAIEPGATFKKLKLDSLDLVSVAMSLEDRLGVQIPDNELAGIETFGQAVELLERKVGAAA